MMSKLMKETWSLPGKFQESLSTSCVFFKRLTSVFLTTQFTTLFRIILVTCPSSDFEGLISLHVGWLSKFGLWSFRQAKASFSVIFSTQSSNRISLAVFFTSMLIEFTSAQFDFLYVFMFFVLIRL